MRSLAVFILVLVNGCRSREGVAQLSPAEWRVQPARFTFPATYVGATATAHLDVLNAGEAPGELELAVTAPFAVPARLTRGGGASAPLEISFAPAQPGHFTATLAVGPVQVELQGDGLEPLECTAPLACADARFDASAGVCVTTQHAQGTACSTRCITGTCNAGTCIGQLTGCDDGDACTIDTCDEAAGCNHPPVECPPPTGPCRVARCDPHAGCGVEDAIDGTLCGPDDCLAETVDVCIAGQCTSRPRPALGRCRNTWVPYSIPGRSQHALAFDAVRQRLVVFGGEALGGEVLADTWVGSGGRFEFRTPSQSPPARRYAAMVYDAARRRVVLFGGLSSSAAGAAPLNDTWEWDGTTWLERRPAVAPSPRWEHALAYDAVRARVVLFGGADGGGTPLSDTWEWDGASWQLRSTPARPSGRFHHAMAYDGTSQRTVLFGGIVSSSLSLSDTWEWDGSAWSPRVAQSAPPSGGQLAWDAHRSRLVLLTGSGTWEWEPGGWVQRDTWMSWGRYALAYDAAARRVVLFGSGIVQETQTLEWNGASWSRREGLLEPRTAGPMTWDPVRARVLMFSVSNDLPTAAVWAWYGTSWHELDAGATPASRSLAGLAFDTARGTAVLYGGLTGVGSPELAELTAGDSWIAPTPPASPPSRWQHGMAYDPVHGQTVVYGGAEHQIGVLSGDTWLWDGGTWQPGAAGPVRVGHAMAWDAARGRVVAFGGAMEDAGLAASTLEWDGTQWHEVTDPGAPPARKSAAMAYDEERGRMLLFGGFTRSSSLGDTWERGDAGWTQRTPAVSPPAGAYRMAYDAARHRAVMLGAGGTWVFLP